MRWVTTSRKGIPISVETLTVRRFVSAAAERVFAAWTDPLELVKWWGPDGVRCVAAEIDLRVGGQYRIANEFPDQSVLWISGQFEVIERPELLIYSWNVENDPSATERVTVQFLENHKGTDVVITHERIATSTLREQHRQGWDECIDGLVSLLREKC